MLGRSDLLNGENCVKFALVVSKLCAHLASPRLPGLVRALD
jgi:hypothetical protein